MFKKNRKHSIDTNAQECDANEVDLGSAVRYIKNKNTQSLPCNGINGNLVKMDAIRQFYYYREMPSLRDLFYPVA